MRAKKVRCFVVFSLLMSGCSGAGEKQAFDAGMVDATIGEIDAGIPYREVRRENGKKANDGPAEFVRPTVAPIGDGGS